MMLHSALYLLAAVAVFGAVTSSVFSGMTVRAVRQFVRLRRQERVSEFCPPVSVLKPLHGPEPELEARLESFYRQDYPTFEMIFCARHEDDAGLCVARRVAARFPHVPTKILTCGEPPWPNARSWSQQVMQEAASFDLLVTADSDVLVTPEYLARVVAPFVDPEVGLVTCIYRGVTRHGLWARMEAMAMSVEMTGGVLVANMLEGMKFALGPTMVYRREALDAIGGFLRAGQYLAEDFVLGDWMAATGRKVVLSTYVLEHHILNSGMISSLNHQMRWARSTRFSRPAGHFGTVLTYAVPFGVLGFASFAALGHLWFGLALLAYTAIGRAALAVYLAANVVCDRETVRRAWLYPLRDLLGFFFWAASYTGRHVSFRGERYRLLPAGRMLREERDAAWVEAPVHALETITESLHQAGATVAPQPEPVRRSA